MKNIFRSFVISSLVLLFIGCKKDDGGNSTVNVPPNQATNINAVVVPNSARVAITWNAATDDNGDQVKYDVIINNELVKTNLTTTSTEVDVSQFLTSASKQALANKGVEVVLKIEIKAYDQSNSFSNASVTKTLLISREPTNFAFESIIFDTDAYDELNIIWTAAIDPDGDQLKYAAYLNDIVLVEDYEIPSGVEFGTAIYSENFIDLSNSEIVVKVVVTESSGETKEISESFDFKGTDVDLGALESPYSSEVQFNVAETEPDNRVGYRFSLTEQTNFAISNSEELIMQIKNATNNTIASDTSLEGVLEPGDYTLIIFGDDSSDVSGTININLTSSSSTDVNLGVLSLPHKETLDIVFDNEEDNIINYYFEVSEVTGYIMSSQYDIIIYDELGNVMQNDEDEGYGSFSAWGSEIPQGKYRIEISSDINGSNNLSINLKNSDQTDRNLGVLANNAIHELTFIPDSEYNFEPDRAARVYFEVEQPTGLIIDPGFVINAELSILDTAGNTYAIVDISNYRKVVDFGPGVYYLQIEFHNYFGFDELSQNIRLQDPVLTDTDWGIISTPETINGNTTVEPDDMVVYTFETLEVSPRWYYSTSDNSGDSISFTDENGNEVPRNGNHPSGEGEAGIDLPPGKYRIEVTDGKGAGSPGYGISFSFNLY